MTPEGLGIILRPKLEREAKLAKARIYKPAKSAMQSGQAETRDWRLEFESSARQRLDPMMGWAGHGDTRDQVRLDFSSLEAAEAYAEKAGLDYRVQRPRAPRRRLKSYADNFR